MSLQRAVVHFIDKTRDAAGRNTPSQLRLRDSLLPINDRAVELSDRLRQLYNGKSGRGYGAFHANLDTYPLSGMLDQFEDPNWDFLAFSRRAMSVLQQRINQEALATGGYIFFALYTEAASSYLLVASLKNRPGLVFNNALELAAQDHIDLDQLHEMARINLSLWQQGGERYVSFAKRRTSANDFTIYFREFIGVDEFTESKALTRNLIQALGSYNEVPGTSDELRRQRRERTFAYCQELYLSGQRLSIQGLSTRLDPDNPGDFLNYVNGHTDIQVSDDFEPDRSIFKRLQRYVGKDRWMSLSFDADQIGNRIIYNRDEGTILIRDIPQNLRAQLDEA